jgi:hypothetical protein
MRCRSGLIPLAHEATVPAAATATNADAKTGGVQSQPSRVNSYMAVSGTPTTKPKPVIST